MKSNKIEENATSATTVHGDNITDNATANAQQSEDEASTGSNEDNINAEDETVPSVNIPPRLFERLVRNEKDFDEQGMSAFSQISLLMFIAMILGFYIYLSYEFNFSLDISALFRPRWH